MTGNAIELPNIECCPDCGGEALSAVSHTIEGCEIDLDGEGGVTHWNTGLLHNVLVSHVECLKCGVPLVEDGTVVHEDIDDE